MSLRAHLGCAENPYGEVGIEIEVEGRNLPDTGRLGKYWRVETDNSLRGESREFVLAKPIARNKVQDALAEIQTAYKELGTKVNDSYRAGIHVHVNCQDMNARQLINFVFLYLMYEDCLINFCSESRRGNHFCLRASEANYLPRLIADCIANGDLRAFATNDIRYSGINLAALHKFGSVEFRALESTQDWDKIQAWTDILLCLKDAAYTFECPTDIVGGFSVDGFEAFSSKIFGKKLPVIQNLLNEEYLYEGVRNIQFAAYSREWSKVNFNIFKREGSIFS